MRPSSKISITFADRQRGDDLGSVADAGGPGAIGNRRAVASSNMFIMMNGVLRRASVGIAVADRAYQKAAVRDRVKPPG